MVLENVRCQQVEPPADRGPITGKGCRHTRIGRWVQDAHRRRENGIVRSAYLGVVQGALHAEIGVSIAAFSCLHGLTRYPRERPEVLLGRTLDCMQHHALLERSANLKHFQVPDHIHPGDRNSSARVHIDKSDEFQTRYRLANWGAPHLKNLLSSLSETKAPGASLPPTIISSISSNARSASDRRCWIIFSGLVARATDSPASASFRTKCLSKALQLTITTQSCLMHATCISACHKLHSRCGSRQGPRRCRPGRRQ
jgi:hypothetical protein